MTNYIYSYNVDTDEYKIVFEKDEPVHIEELFSYGKYLFFYVSGKDAGIKRFDTVSGELEKVNKQGTLSTLRDGMIIWSKGSNSYVATDLLGNDPKPYDPMIYNGYLHKNELVNRMFITMYRISKNGTDEKKLFENALFPVRVNNYMFYYGVFDDMEQHPIFPDRPEGGTTLCNGDIYIMPLDTEEVRLLCHVDGVSLHMDNSVQNHFVCGDWKGFIISPTKQFIDKTGYEVTDNDMVIVNVKTGEYHISRYIE